MSEESLATLLREIKGHKFENLYFATLFTGIRQGEILGLTWDCINFEKGMILINKQLQKEKKINGKYNLVSLKNGKFRKITPAKAVIDVLKLQRKIQNEQHLKYGPSWNNEDNLVFTNEFGKHLSHFTIYKHLK